MPPQGMKPKLNLHNLKPKQETCKKRVRKKPLSKHKPLVVQVLTQKVMLAVSGWTWIPKRQSPAVWIISKLSTSAPFLCWKKNIQWIWQNGVRKFKSVAPDQRQVESVDDNVCLHDIQIDLASEGTCASGLHTGNVSLRLESYEKILVMETAYPKESQTNSRQKLMLQEDSSSTNHCK